MVSTAEILLKFKVAQLEGKLAIYETLIPETEKLEIMEKVVAGVKSKLEVVVAVWDKHNLEKDSARGA